MKDKIIDALIITIEYLIVILVALLIFIYVVVPLAHKTLQEKTIYVDRPCPVNQSVPEEITEGGVILL